MSNLHYSHKMRGKKLTISPFPYAIQMGEKHFLVKNERDLGKIALFLAKTFDEIDWSFEALPAHLFFAGMDSSAMDHYTQALNRYNESQVLQKSVKQAIRDKNEQFAIKLMDQIISCSSLPFIFAKKIKFDPIPTGDSCG